MKKHNLDLVYGKYLEQELENNVHLFDHWDWLDISCKQKLSESFIEEYSDKLWWRWISRYQGLSEKFIAKHSDKILILYLMDNDNISEELKEKIKKEINLLKEII
jgi:hypothetical protein